MASRYSNLSAAAAERPTQDRFPQSGGAPILRPLLRNSRPPDPQTPRPPLVLSPVYVHPYSSSESFLLHLLCQMEDTSKLVIKKTLCFASGLLVALRGPDSEEVGVPCLCYEGCLLCLSWGNAAVWNGVRLLVSTCTSGDGHLQSPAAARGGRPFS